MRNPFDNFDVILSLNLVYLGLGFKNYFKKSKNAIFLCHLNSCFFIQIPSRSFWPNKKLKFYCFLSLKWKFTELCFKIIEFISQKLFIHKSKLYTTWLLIVSSAPPLPFNLSFFFHVFIHIHFVCIWKSFFKHQQQRVYNQRCLWVYKSLPCILFWW